MISQIIYYKDHSPSRAVFRGYRSQWVKQKDLFILLGQLSSQGPSPPSTRKKGPRERSLLLKLEVINIINNKQIERNFLLVVLVAHESRLLK